ncbi:19235_t:CDS:2 [Entrophospora sp. SA101]|nr:9410_t:CDS:2 [Entrophospora sp. SA101]CAJ0748223.1 19235_t:CDS:2 [Entrophospora sp. SA101]CAJ0868683.1 1359_t:CDS:2 [Entrophospora sp. SA101]
MKILALDPSGTSTTGIFLYENWKQAKNLENLVKKEKVDILACEVSTLWQKQSHTYHFDNLIKLVGHCEYLAQELGIEYVPVSNQYMNKWEAQAKEGKIAGLVCQEVQGKGRPKQI